MEENFKLIVNGKEVEFPFNINDMFAQLVPKEMNSSQPTTPKLKQPVKVHPLHPSVLPGQHQIIKKVVLCKDTEARNVIIKLNKRIKMLEEILIKKQLIKQRKVKKSSVTKKKVTKSNSNTKGGSKTKGRSKTKAKKIAGKKIGKKK